MGPEPFLHMAERAKPKGRNSHGKALNPDVKPARRGSLVEFAIRKSHYVVDVNKMCQVNLSSGNRRLVWRKSATSWHFNAASSGASRSTGEAFQWARYAMNVEDLLEEAFRECCSRTGAAPDNGKGLGPLEPAPGPPATLREAAARAEATTPGGLDPESRSELLGAALAPGAPRGPALQALRVLTEHHGMRCSAEDARLAALCTGSMAALQLVLRSNPGVQLLGLDVFERRFGNFCGRKINDEGIKHCLKALLARGACLGQPSSVPASKLLRKLDADAFPAWAQRYFSSMARAGMELPEQVQARVEAFLWSETA